MSATDRNIARIPAFRLIAAMLDDNEEAMEASFRGVFAEIWTGDGCVHHRRDMLHNVALELAWMLAMEVEAKYDTKEQARNAVLRQIHRRLQDAEREQEFDQTQTTIPKEKLIDRANPHYAGQANADRGPTAPPQRKANRPHYP
jgi:hypothetical protein